MEALIAEKKILPSLTPGQQNYLINYLNSVRNKAIISPFADSGLLLIESDHINPANIDLGRKLIKVRCKGNKEGHAPFGERTGQLLKERLSRYSNNGRLWNLNNRGISWR
jgi:site-specific recombinase XerC